MSTPPSADRDAATSGTPARPWWRVGALMVFAIAILAFNLRPVATQVGPVLPTLQRDLGMSGTVAGLLTSLPTLCFALFGAAAPTLAARFGPHRVILASLLALVIGSLARTTVSSTGPFLAWSTLALAGMAVCNVLTPSIVRRHFAQHVGMVTAIYSLTISIGVTLASVVTVPLTHALSGWRPAFAVTMSVAVIAVIPWVLALKHDRVHRPATSHATITLARVARTRLGWMMALFFGFQSAQAYSIFGWLPTIYQAAGLSESRAGLMLGLATGLGIPLAFLWPAYTARNPRPVGLLLIVSVAGAIGYTGLLVAPATLPWLWAALIAVGTSAFPMILALFGLKARTSEGTAALSGFGQSVGYLIALFGPFLMGAVHEATGSWHWPVLLLLAMNVPMAITGVIACRSGWIEDELAARESSTPTG